MKDIYDITIIGGGPSGLFAAFYAGLRQSKTKLIDSQPSLGGQLTSLYPDKYIYDVPGYPAIKAKDLIANLIQQMAPFKQDICLNETVLSFSKNENHFTIKTTNAIHHTKTIIIAAGNGSFQPRRLTLDGAKAIENKQLHYYIDKPSLFENKEIVICGGGDSAVDWALMLESIAKKVTLIHRRPKFRAHEHSLEQLNASSVIVKAPFVIDSLNQENNRLKTISIKSPQSECTEKLFLDHLIVNYGFSSSLGAMKEWPFDFNGTSICIKSDTSTSIPGVFAVGDITTYEGKVNLIATGFGEAPTAVNNAIHFYNPTKRVQPMHSTSLFGI